MTEISPGGGSPGFIRDQRQEYVEWHSPGPLRFAQFAGEVPLVQSTVSAKLAPKLFGTPSSFQQADSGSSGRVAADRREDAQPTPTFLGAVIDSRRGN